MKTLTITFETNQVKLIETCFTILPASIGTAIAGLMPSNARRSRQPNRVVIMAARNVRHKSPLALILQWRRSVNRKAVRVGQAADVDTS